MPRVTFLRDFDCPCKPGVYIAYKAGGPKLIPTAHAERARAAGVLADGPSAEISIERSQVSQASGAGADRGPRRGGE